MELAKCRLLKSNCNGRRGIIDSINATSKRSTTQARNLSSQLLSMRERAGGFSEAFAQDEVRLILQLAAPKIVQQSDRLVSEPPHVLRLPWTVGCFLLHIQFDRIRAELRCGYFENGRKIDFKTGTADVF